MRMGKGDRERRRARLRTTGDRQRRRDTQRGPATPTPHGAAPPPLPEEHARQLVAVAVEALRRGGDSRWDATLAELAEPGAPGWGRAVDRALFSGLERQIARSWQNGWQPTELVRVLTRELDRAAGALATDMVAAENRRHAAARIAPEWSRQLRDLGAEPWWGADTDHARLFAEHHGLDRLQCVRLAVRVTAVLRSLPRLQVLCPLPGQASSKTSEDGIDPAKLARIRHLLAKAEATEFPEEAEALTGRAQELMARHSIDHAAVVAESGDTGEVHGRRLPVEAPYESYKAALLNVIAQANRCRAVWHRQLALCTVLGYPGDVDAVELLFTSLLVQATTAMRLAGSTRDRHGRSTTRSFRASFLSAFADRIGERLMLASHTGEREAVREHAEAGTDLVPVLARRSERVEEAFHTTFPEVEQTELSVPTNTQGWEAGWAAADAATLHTRDRVTS